MLLGCDALAFAPFALLAVGIAKAIGQISELIGCRKELVHDDPPFKGLIERETEHIVHYIMEVWHLSSFWLPWHFQYFSRFEGYVIGKTAYPPEVDPPLAGNKENPCVIVLKV